MTAEQLTKISEWLGWNPDGLKDETVLGLARDKLNQSQRVRYINHLRVLLGSELKRAVSDFDLLDASTTTHAAAVIHATKS